MDKRLKHLFILILVMILILSVFLFAVYLPNISNSSTYNFDKKYDEDSSTIDKHVVYIGKELSDITEYQSAMFFRSMFGAYNNIDLSIYDSQNSLDMQMDYLNTVSSEIIDVIVLNPIDYEEELPLIIKFYENSVPVILIGNYKISPYYTSIDFSPVSTGKLLAKSTLSKINCGNISLILKSENSTTSDIIKSFSYAISRNESISIRSISMMDNLSGVEVMEHIDLITQNDSTIILDSYSFDKIYDILSSQGYSGSIYVITRSNDYFTHMLENDNLTYIFQNSELFNERLFETLLGIFNNTSAKPHIEVEQIVINKDNIADYIY